MQNRPTPVFAIFVLLLIQPIQSQVRLVIYPPIHTGGSELTWLNWGFSKAWSSALTSGGVDVVPQDSVFELCLRDAPISDYFNGQFPEKIKSTVVVTGFYYLRDDTLRLSIRSWDSRTNISSKVLLIDGPCRNLSQIPDLVERSFHQLSDHLIRLHNLPINEHDARRTLIQQTRPASFVTDNTKAWISFNFQDAAERAAKESNRKLEKKYLDAADKALQGTRYSLGQKRNLLTGMRALDENRFNDAVTALKVYLLANPEDLEALRALATAQAGAKSTEQALESYGQIIQREPSDVNALVQSGRILTELNRTREASDSFSKALEIDPTNAAVHTGLGFVDWKNKKKKTALIHFERALELDSLDALANYGLGMLLSSKKKTRNDAVSYLERSLRLDPTQADAEIITKKLASLRKKKKK